MIKAIRFSRFLKEYLADEEFGVCEFAEMLDVSHSTVKGWLHGNNPFRSRKLLRDYFGDELNEVIEFSLRELLWKYAEVTGKRQTEIADYVGVHRQIVNMWCCGHTNPVGRNMKRLEQMLREGGVIE